MFGEVFLRSMLPRGGAFEFVDQVKGGTDPGQFIAVEKGVRQVPDTGVIAGYPVKDVRDRLRRQATGTGCGLEIVSSPPAARPSSTR